MSDVAPKSGFFATAVAFVGGFLIFAVIVAIVYLPNRAEPLPQGTKTPEERAAILRELRAREAASANSYGWVDQTKGIVRIPIERAMQLTVEDYKAK